MAVLPLDPLLSHPSLERLAAERSPDVHTVIDLAGEFLYLSGAATGLFGWTPAELVGTSESALLHPDDLAVVAEGRRHGRDFPGRATSVVCRVRCGAGNYRWVEVLSRTADGPDGQVTVSSMRDIEDRKERELDLERQASTDPLTGVANRTVFMDRLRHALRRIDRRRGLVTVLFLDLDRFKLINDSVGHLVGDLVLQQMAARLQHFLRPEDTLARLGGDEFAIVVEDISDAAEAVTLAERIIEAGRLPFVMGDEHFTCTTSVGIAVTGDSQRSAEDLLQEADLALYRAKDRGRDRAEVFDEALRRHAVDRLGTERMLRRAIDEHRLRLQYQPIIDLKSGLTVAVEALVRVWDPASGSLIAAEEFIAVAEEVGLLPAMDDWVLSVAIDQATEWHTMLGASQFTDVAINLTARHLADPGFAQSLVDELARRHLPAGRFQIEVTERVLMEASTLR
jgi:diguanylate cyclase (GGDEF)-like protein/PAS domain S-box-containing protein